jgi:hypothetical protein
LILADSHAARDAGSRFRAVEPEERARGTNEKLHVCLGLGNPCTWEMPPLHSSRNVRTMYREQGREGQGRQKLVLVSTAARRIRVDTEQGVDPWVPCQSSRYESRQVPLCQTVVQCHRGSMDDGVKCWSLCSWRAGRMVRNLLALQSSVVCQFNCLVPSSHQPKAMPSQSEGCKRRFLSCRPAVVHLCSARTEYRVPGRHHMETFQGRWPGRTMRGMRDPGAALPLVEALRFARGQVLNWLAPEARLQVATLMVLQ